MRNHTVKFFLSFCSRISFSFLIVSRSACSLSMFKLWEAMFASFASYWTTSLRILSVARIVSAVCSNVSWICAKILWASRPTGSFLASLHIYNEFSTKFIVSVQVILRNTMSWDQWGVYWSIIPENCFIHHCICSIKAFLDRITLQLELPGIFQDPFYVWILLPAVLSNLFDPLNIRTSWCHLFLIRKFSCKCLKFLLPVVVEGLKLTWGKKKTTETYSEILIVTRANGLRCSQQIKIKK